MTGASAGAARPDAGAVRPVQALAGRRVLVTRPRAQAPAWCAQLAALGAEPILFPTIEIAPLEDYSALDAGLRSLADYDWIVLTSVNGVDAVWRRLDGLGLAGLSSVGARFAAVGPATARALEQRGVPVAVVPSEYVAEALAASLGPVAGLRLLLPQAELARDVLADELARRGALVHALAAYRTLPAEPDPTGLAELRRGVDALTFTSASAAVNFVHLLTGGGRRLDAGALRPLENGPNQIPRPEAGLGMTQPGRPVILEASRAGLPRPWLNRAIVACIGPVTAQAAHEAGLPVDVVPAEYTLAGLAAALAGYFARPELQR